MWLLYVRQKLMKKLGKYATVSEFFDIILVIALVFIESVIAA